MLSYSDIFRLNDRFKRYYIIVAGPVASGKSTLAILLALCLYEMGLNPYYIDKDALGGLTETGFRIGHRRYNRFGKFFRKYFRVVEYVVTEIITLYGLAFNNWVISNAPYNGELKDLKNGKVNRHLRLLADQVHRQNAVFLLIFIKGDRQLLRERLLKRAKEDPEAYKRDRYILKKIDKMIGKQLLEPPSDEQLRQYFDHYFIFDANDPEGSFRLLKEYLGVSSDRKYDPDSGKQYRSIIPAVKEANADEDEQ